MSKSYNTKVLNTTIVLGTMAGAIWLAYQASSMNDETFRWRFFYKHQPRGTVLWTNYSHDICADNIEEASELFLDYFWGLQQNIGGQWRANTREPIFFGPCVGDPSEPIESYRTYTFHYIESEKDGPDHIRKTFSICTTGYKDALAKYKHFIATQEVPKGWHIDPEFNQTPDVDFCDD